MVSSLEKFNTFVSKDDGWGDIGKYHEPNPDHMTPGFGKPNAKSTVPKNTGDFNHQFETIQTQPHSVTFNYQGGVKAVHENHYNKADHVAQQSYHVKQAKVAKTAGDTTKSIGHTNAAAAHGYQSRNMVQPGHDTLTESRGITHHGYYDDNPAMPWVGKADTDTYRKKLLNNPDIVPPQGQTKEEVVDGMINQKIRQRKNNKRANNLLNAEIADPGGGAKAGGDSAMYRLTSFVQKPIEAADDGTPPIWGEPKESHIKKANRLIEYIDIDPDKVKLDDPPKYKDKVHKKELQLIKSYSEKLKDDEFIDEVTIQDEDLEEPFYRYLRDNELRIDKDIMKQINRDTSSLVHKFKIFYNRPRPHQVDDDIKEIDNIAGKSPSYPSGHSTNSYVMGEYLANKFPEHADELRNIGKRVGLNRVIVGLHHPTDHMAGVKLGEQIVRTIPGMDDVKKSDAFMDELFKYMAHREELFKDFTQIGGQDILADAGINKQDGPKMAENIMDLTQAHFDAAGLKDISPEDTLTANNFETLRNSGMLASEKQPKAIDAINPETPTAPPTGDLPNVGTNGLGKLPPNGIYISQEKPPKDAKLYATKGGAQYWIPDPNHHWSTGGEHGTHNKVTTSSKASESHGAGWSHNVSFTKILPDGVVPKENTLENKKLLSEKSGQNYIPHQTKFTKDEFKNGIDTPFEMKLPGGLNFSGGTVKYSRAFRPSNSNGRAFVVVDIKYGDGSKHARHAFYTRTGSGSANEKDIEISDGVKVSADGPTSQSTFVPVDGISKRGWYNKTRYFQSHKDNKGNSTNIPWHMKRYGNDALKVIARTLDSVGIEGMPGHEDTTEDYKIKARYESPLENGQINKLISSKHSLSNNININSDEFKESWGNYSDDGAHSFKNEGDSYKEQGAVSRFLDRVRTKSLELEKHTEEEHEKDHRDDESDFDIEEAKRSLAEQIKQIKNKIETGSYGIEKSEDIFLKKAPDYTFDKFLTPKQFDEFKNFAEFKKYKEDFLTALDAKVNAFQGEDRLRNTYKSAKTDAEKKLNMLTQSNFNISGKKIYEQLDRINRLEDLLKQPNAEEPKAETKSKKPTKKSTDNKSTAKKPTNKSTAKKPTAKENTPKKSTNKSTKSTKTEVEESKLKIAHQNRINKIQETRQEVTKHLDAFNKEKDTFKKFGHEEKFKNAIKEYEKAKDVETEYRSSQEKRGTPQPDATKGQDYMDAPTAPKYTSEEQAYINRRNKLIDLARKKELGKKHYEQNHSSEFDTHYGNEEAAEAELFNQSNDKLASALKRLDKQPEEKPPTSDDTKVVGKPSSTQLRAQEKNIMDQVQGISDKYFDKDAFGSFKIKDGLDKFDVIYGMKELQRITEEEWKGDNNEFNRNEDGSITDNNNKAAKKTNREQILGNKSFSTVSAVGASLRTQGLMNKFGMDKKESQKVVDSIKDEYEQKDTDFMNPNTEEGKKHIAESEDRSEYEASLKDHEEYKDATNWGKGRPEGKGDDGLHGSKLFNTDEAKESQKPKTAGEVATKDMQLQQSPKYQEMSESTKNQLRRSFGLPPEGSIPPMFQGEEENETVQGVWHPETGRWAKPDTISGATGHFASMKDNTMMHLTGKEFDDAQGKIVPDKDGVTGGTRHDRTGEDIIAHKDNDGKMTYHTTSSGELDRFGHRRLSGPSDRAKTKREAAMDAIVMEIKNDSKKTPFGGKKTYSTDGTKGVLSYKGGVEFKPRKFQFNPAGVRDKIGDGASRITRRASASLQRFGDRAASNIKNEDAYKLIREAKGKKKTLGRKPNMNINSPNNRARLDKFNTEQLTELKNHINFFRGGE